MSTFKCKEKKINQRYKMIIRAIYEDGVLKPLKKLDLPERTEVRVIIRGSFSKLIEELGEIEAKEDIDEFFGRMRNRNYYG